MKVVFLHGVGEDGDADREWLDALNGALVQAGHPAIGEPQVIAPRYAGLLSTDGISAKMPDLTYKPKDDRPRRREFERRQAGVQRLLQHHRSVQTFGFNRLHDAASSFAHATGVRMVPWFHLRQVRRYVDNEPLRGAILRSIIDELPGSGDIVLIGHSLGSVVAIDLLDHLKENLRVRRFITIGSPANSEALHRGSERLLKKFPYSRVDDWTNVFSIKDPVTQGRGLASVFSGAQDFAVDITGVFVHPSKQYLAHPAVAQLVADVLYPSKSVVRASSDIAVRLSDEQLFSLIKLHFAWAVSKKIKDSEAAGRYADALRLLQDDFADQLRQASDAGHPLPDEMHTVIAGHLPRLPHRLEMSEVVVVLTLLTATNFVEPYEIDTGDAPKEVLGDMAEQLGFRRALGEKIVTALTDVDKLLKRSGGIPWGRIGIAAAGLALLAAGPVGIAAAAPASAFGAAAITGGLAAFGPGGMVGGLAMLGGLASGGAAVTASAAASGGATGENLALNVIQLSLQVAADHALKLLDLPTDTELWDHLVALETQIAAELNRLETFSDAKAARVQQLRAAQEAVTKLLGFVVDKQLGGAAGIEDRDSSD